MPRTSAGRTYKTEWQSLATYLATAYPGVRHGSVAETTIWLLDHLKRIESMQPPVVRTLYTKERRRVHEAGEWAAMRQTVQGVTERLAAVETLLLALQAIVCPPCRICGVPVCAGTAHLAWCTDVMARKERSRVLLQRLRDAGRTKASIARLLGVQRSTVQWWCEGPHVMSPRNLAALEQLCAGLEDRPTNTNAVVEDAMAQARRLLGEEGRH